MKNKTISWQIMVWAEIIIAARILLFAVPVIINKKMTGGIVTACSINDTFITFLAIPAICYLAVGIVTLMGNRMWRVLHFVTVGITLVLTGVLLSMVAKQGSPMSPFYFLPGVASIVVLMGVLKTKCQCNCS